MKLGSSEENEQDLTLCLYLSFHQIKENHIQTSEWKVYVDGGAHPI